jgi:hypothetical protein
MQRNFPETLFRQLQAGGNRGDLSLMAASLTGLTGLTGLAAGLGLPFGFPEISGKSENRFLHKRTVNEDDGDQIEKNSEKFGETIDEIFGAKRRKPNKEGIITTEINGDRLSPAQLPPVQCKYRINNCSFNFFGPTAFLLDMILEITK